MRCAVERTRFRPEGASGDGKPKSLAEYARFQAVVELRRPLRRTMSAACGWASSHERVEQDVSLASIVNLVYFVLLPAYLPCAS